MIFPFSATQPKKTNTKIPVYHKQAMGRKRTSASASATAMPAATLPVAAGAGGERNSALSRQRGSLMMATKSSSAKMVPKMLKEQPQAKNVRQDSKPAGKQRPRSPSTAVIPIMERSGTFLKDEPTFGDKTTNIDIDE